MTTLAQNIKTQILAVMQTLITNGVINSFEAIDRGKDPISETPPTGYPFAIISMPKVANDMEDNRSNLRSYSWNILFLFNLANSADYSLTIEGAIDNVLNAFDTAFTLNGSAVGAIVPPAEVQAFPVSTPEQDLAAFVVTISARGIYDIGT